MLRPRREHRETQPSEQVVEPRKFVRHAELLLENAEHVAAAQRAHTVLFARPFKDALSERLVLFRLQPCRPSGLLDRSHRVEAVVTIDVAPPLHKAS